jgi:CheY-like chemotaxis protein
LAAEAASLGVQKALLKARCSPALLLQAVKDVLAGASDRSEIASTSGDPNLVPKGEQVTASAKARDAFLQNASQTCAELRSLCRNFVKASNPAQREAHLQALYRKVHSIASTAGPVECHRLAQMAGALEALLFDLSQKPAAATPSVLRTVANTVDFLALLFDCARDADAEAPPPAQALVVDDDPLSNRLMVSTLNRAQIQASSTEDPLVALQWLEQRRFDLVLLDIEMPTMDGFELCMRLRTLPGYDKTPVIYVTSHSDFDNRTKSVLSGGNDLISKPVFAMDLAVKTVALLLKHQLGIA